MNYLVLDVETSGLPNKDLSLDNPDQARVVQLGLILMDSQFRETAHFCTLIKPTGWRMNKFAQAAHNIPIEKCEAEGMDIEKAIEVFQAFNTIADYRIGHNIRFDGELIDTEAFLIGGYEFHWNTPQVICTMMATTNLCKIPKPSNPSTYKWPKLEEAHQILLGEPFSKGHDALEDVRATARIFKHLVVNKLITLVTI